MNQRLLLPLCLVLTFLGKSQTVTPTVLSNGGNFVQSAGGSIEWTIGEPVSSTYNSTTNITTMGFHQTELGLAEMIRDQEGNSDLLIYPNPVHDQLNLNFSGMARGIYSVTLVDAIGRLIYESKADINEGSNQVTIKVNEYAAGNYFLLVKTKDFNKTVKINKVN